MTSLKDIIWAFLGLAGIALLIFAALTVVLVMAKLAMWAWA